MSTQTFTSVSGLNGALRQLPKVVTAELRDAAQDISRDVAARAAARGAGIGRTWKYVAPTIKARRDRVPVVAIGGARRMAGHKGASQTVGDVMWGTEFGGGARPTTRQFLPHLGRTGYALWPTIRDMEHAGLITGRYFDALGDALNRVG